MHATLPLLENTDFPAIKRSALITLQVNLGYLCNQQCLHCHVNASPKRKEIMSKESIDEVITFLAQHKLENLDLTGGAPELNPHFRYLVQQARKIGVHVIDRCNLTILSEPGQETLTRFLADNNVEIFASLPCYEVANVDGQRGKGVHQSSIAGIKKLNEAGYGSEDTNLKLNLVYNPGGAYLPPAQSQLEDDYKRELQQRYQIYFNQLYTITNMPIKRFGSTLISKGTFEDYMQLLKSAYQPQNLSTVMCRSLISVDWQGYIYDCDFNQMLDLPVKLPGSIRPHLRDITLENMNGNSVAIADHCYGCTAGQGSSCGGALT